MNEASVTRDFKHWLEKNKPRSCTVYEFKIVKLDKQKSFAFNRVADHQIKGLLDSLEGFWLKIPDTSAINGFSSQKPFDSLWCVARDAFVVVIYYLPHKVKTAVLIPIKDFVKLKATYPKKSIHLEELQFEKVKL